MTDRKVFLVNGVTKEKYIVNGCKAAEETPEMPGFNEAMIYQSHQLPNAVDLRPYMTPVENQGNTSSCVANALVGAYEYLLKRQQNQNVDVSRLFLYYNARLRSNPYSQWVTDTGCFIHKGIESLQNEGTCLENEWPFVPQAVNERPHQNLYSRAKPNVIADAVKLNVDINEMKSCLAQGYPFVFSLKLFRSMALSKNNGGFLASPQPGETSLGQHGLHAMLAVGYIDPYKLFIVRNSWGPQWGDQGYIYVAYDYMGSREYCSEIYAIRKLNNMDLGQQHWISDPYSVRIGEPNSFGAGPEGNIDNWGVEEATDDE